MMTSQRRHIAAFAAGITVLVYVALAGLSTGCLLVHAGSSAGHSHHEQGSSHSPLCAWSCQATSHAALISEPPTLATRIVFSAAPAWVAASPSAQRVEWLHARAPPLRIFS
jgi:hypothetical protein